MYQRDGRWENYKSAWITTMPWGTDEEQGEQAQVVPSLCPVLEDLAPMGGSRILEPGRSTRTFFLKYTDDLSKRSVLFP